MSDPCDFIDSDEGREESFFLRDITDTVLTLLEEHKEQWESDPRQGLISTCFIAACKTGQIVFDFPEAA